jgi:hypothetical protein
MKTVKVREEDGVFSIDPKGDIECEVGPERGGMVTLRAPGVTMTVPAEMVGGAKKQKTAAETEETEEKDK